MRWKRTADSQGVASERQGRAVGWRRIGAARMISINHSGRRDAERTSSLPLSTGNPSSISLISFSRAFRSRNNPQDGRAQWGAEWQQEGGVIMTLMRLAISHSDDRTFLSGEHDSVRKDTERLLRPFCLLFIYYYHVNTIIIYFLKVYYTCLNIEPFLLINHN